MRSFIFYTSVLLLFLGGIVGTLFIGHEMLSSAAVSSTSEASLSSVDSIFGSLLNLVMKQFHHPLALLLSQIIIIMIATRAFGFIVTKIALPVVVGEIIAGIFLGPSFFWSLFPGIFRFSFSSNFSYES